MERSFQLLGSASNLRYGKRRYGWPRICVDVVICCSRAWEPRDLTQLIEGHLTDELDDRLSSFADPWVEVVNMFIARCTYLDETTGFGSSLFSPGDPPRVSFGGTCLPEDDRPS